MTIEQLRTGGFKAVLEAAITAAGLTETQAAIVHRLAYLPGVVSQIDQPLTYLSTPEIPHADAAKRLNDQAAAFAAFSNAVNDVAAIVAANPGSISSHWTYFRGSYRTRVFT